MGWSKPAGCADRRRPARASTARSRLSANARLASTFWPDHLHVDGRRQAEVQNLADDVGRQEIERDAGKLARQTAAAARACNSPVGRWLRLQRDQDIGVHGADRRRGAVGQVDGAVGQADVIDDRAQFLRRESRAGSSLPPGRRAAPSLRCACRSWRAGAA